MKGKTSILLAAALPLLLALFLCGGCGGKAKDPAQLVDEAVRAARDAGSVHAQMNVGLEPLEGEAGVGMKAQGDAWLDMDAEVLEARFTVMGMELSLRYLDGKAYLQWGGGWYELSGEIVSGVGAGAIPAAFGVLMSYPDLLASAVEAEERGGKSVGGNECVEIGVVPDLAAVAALEPVRELAAELGMTPREVEEYLEAAGLEMRVCVQKGEPVIREIFLAADVELPRMGGVAGISVLPERARVEITVGFPEYGMQVEVQAPSDVKPFKGL